MKITPIPVLNDNYIWHGISETNFSFIVDPALAEPVDKFLSANNIELDAIIITHHHYDHVGGIEELKAKYNCKVYGPSYDDGRIPGMDIALKEGDYVSLNSGQILDEPLDSSEDRAGPQVASEIVSQQNSPPQPTHGPPCGPIVIPELCAKVLFVPGHTSGHIAYWFEKLNILFCGDTLFSLGCGRLFEGTPEQMWQSLTKIKELPEQTKIYCTHEYTFDNARFALTVDPENPELLAKMKWIESMRDHGRPTVPTELAEEKKINPFLRPHDENIRFRLGMTGPSYSDSQVFAKIRELKDHFQ